jgi:subtilisin family serine protease
MGVPVSNPEVPNVVANSFIVVYNSTFDDEVITSHQSKWMAKVAKANIGKRSADGRALSTKASAFQLGTWRAMALEADERMMNQIFDADEVSYIEQDARISINALSTQAQAPSGLARLSSRAAGDASYVFDSTAGEGITAYIVDTGIRATHSEFQGRATFAANFVNNVVRIPVCSISGWG